MLLLESLNAAQFVNADLIAQGLSPFAPAKSAIQAGRLILRRIRELRDQRASFAFETTLATRSYVSFLRNARELSYIVHVVYIWLSSVELALSRLPVRVQQGGHDVPAEIIERRFWRGLRNFFGLYRPIADTWIVCDNSAEELVIVARGNQGVDPTVFQSEMFARI